MSSSFAKVVAERSEQPKEEVVKQALRFLSKYKMVSSTKVVSLNEVSWLAAMMVMATKEINGGPATVMALEEKTDEPRIITRVATSNVTVDNPR